MRFLLDKLRDRRVLLVLLAVSLAGNVFLAAVFGGALLGRRLPILFFARSQIREALRDLPEARQEDIRRVLRRDIVPDLRQSFAEQEQLRRDLTRLMEAPDVSREALEKQFAAIRDITTQTQRRTQERFTDIILSLPPAERQALAAGVRKITR